MSHQMQKRKINHAFRHRYHAMPPYGWMNDPNGFSYFQELYHLFYQYHPYGTTWGPMHWGHLISEDLVQWKDLPIALKPDTVYDLQGVYSGSAIVEDDTLFVYYTGNTEGIYTRQVQCQAYSKNGIYFQKNKDNPVIGTDQIPAYARKEDFRDPKVWKNNDKYYMVIGSRHEEGYGQVLFYVSDKGQEWTFLSDFSMTSDFGTVWECPDMFQLGGKDILLISPQEKDQEGFLYENIHSSIALIGNFDYITGRYQMEKVQELDSGFDFYAPQTMLDKQGRRIMSAWMNMWERRNVLHELDHGWSGSMIFPRELQYNGVKLKQMPVETIKNYHQNKVYYKFIKMQGEENFSGVYGVCIDLELSVLWGHSQLFEISMFTSETSRLLLRLNRREQVISLDRSQTDLKISSNHKNENYIRSVSVPMDTSTTLRILLDKSSAEIFINEGEAVLSCLFYSKEQGQKILFRTDVEICIKDLICHEIII